MSCSNNFAGAAELESVKMADSRLETLNKEKTVELLN